jgi:hypothetical protein
MQPENIRLCEPSSVLDDAWRRLYEAAFPEGERESESNLTKRLEEGKLLYHRTLNEQGDLLGFTMISLASNFSFLAYMATDATRRSSGIGTKHLKRLIELLKEQYPDHLGLFLEIEATDPDTIEITEDEKTTRKRRLNFYTRLGARVVCEQAVYLTPSYSQPGKYWEGELLCIDFSDRVCKHQVASVIREIYARFYMLPRNHELVRKVLTEFQQCNGDCSDEAISCHHPGAGARIVSAFNRLRSWFSRMLTRIRKAFA